MLFQSIITGLQTLSPFIKMGTLFFFPMVSENGSNLIFANKVHSAFQTSWTQNWEGRKTKEGQHS
jgi:hypothetical protein